MSPLVGLRRSGSCRSFKSKFKDDSDEFAALVETTLTGAVNGISALCHLCFYYFYKYLQDTESSLKMCVCLTFRCLGWYLCIPSAGLVPVDVLIGCINSASASAGGRSEVMKQLSYLMSFLNNGKIK